MSAWVIVGCGYTGTRLARTLVGQGAEVIVTRRDPAALAQLTTSLGVRGVRVDLSEPATLAGVIPPGAIVVCLAPPGPDPAGEIHALAQACAGARRLVYVSSTGVYGAGTGGWVDEGEPLAPVTAAGHARVAAEAALGQTTLSHVVLRAAGIHGRERGIAERMRAGTYRIVGDGHAHISRIHVDDLVTAIIAAGESEVTGAINVADDDPAPIGEVADAIAAHLGVPVPPRVAPNTVPPEVAGMLTANRRIANTRLKHDLGVVLRYPSWRDAL